MTDKLRRLYLQTEGLIPTKLNCPNCGKDIDTIDVQESFPLYHNNEKWVWGSLVSPESASFTYYCSECGKELPLTDELEAIVLSAED